MGFFKKTVTDRDWLLSALPLYHSTLPIVGTISDAFLKGYRKELNGAVGKVLDELPSLFYQLSMLPNPESRPARVAARNLRLSLSAYLRLARELSILYELSARGLHQVVASHPHTGDLMYSAHLSAIGAIENHAAQLMRETKDSFSVAARKTGVQVRPQ